MKRLRLLALVPALASLAACRGDDHCDDGHVDDECPPDEMAHTAFVAHEGALVSYALGTGEEQPGTIDDVEGPFGMQALADGHVLVNLSDRDEILVVDGYTMEQVTRIPSSNVRARRPVRSYLTPDRKVWVTLNDGNGGSAAFIDLRSGSDDRFRLVGEVELGAGHHEAAFSRSRPRAVFSNSTECDNLMSVYDYGDLDDIQWIATLAAEDAGLDDADPGEGEFDPGFCDPAGERGPTPAVRGCAAAANGHSFCNLSTTGDIIAVGLDEDEPSFAILETGGSGGGATRLHPAGRYVYTVQSEPRGECVVGGLVVIDSRTDSVVSELELGYDGPGCSVDLAGTMWADAAPGRLTFTLDGNTLYVGLDGLADRVLVVDVGDPANPEQRDSIDVGVGDGGQDVLSGDGSLLVHVDTEDGTLSLIDAPARERLGSIEIGEGPAAVATFGSLEGPSQQVGPFFD